MMVVLAPLGFDGSAKCFNTIEVLRKAGLKRMRPGAPGEQVSNSGVPRVTPT